MSSHLDSMIISHYLVPSTTSLVPSTTSLVLSIYRVMCMFSSSLDFLSLFQGLLISILLCFSLSTYLPTYLPVYPFIQPSINLAMYPSFIIFPSFHSSKLVWALPSCGTSILPPVISRTYPRHHLSAPAQRSSRCCWQSCFDFIRLKVHTDSFHLALSFHIQTNPCQHQDHAPPSMVAINGFFVAAASVVGAKTYANRAESNAAGPKDSNHLDALTHFMGGTSGSFLVPKLRCATAMLSWCAISRTGWSLHVFRPVQVGQRRFHLGASYFRLV